MLKKIYAIYDSKVGHYKQPSMFRNAAEAIRGLEQIVNRDDNEISNYPADFTLFEIGEWDELTCKYNLYAAMINLGTALEFKKDQPSGKIQALK